MAVSPARKEPVPATHIRKVSKPSPAAPVREATVHQSYGGDIDIRQGAWKLIFLVSGRKELYNLKADPSEQRDLAAIELSQRKKLSRRLDGWLKEVGAQMPVPRVGN